MEQSKNYSKVQHYYENRTWGIERVKDAVGKWITVEEYKLITGESLK